MASLTKDKNDSTLLISKVSEFKYRDNFFKSPSDKKTNNSTNSENKNEKPIFEHIIISLKQILIFLFQSQDFEVELPYNKLIVVMTNLILNLNLLNLLIYLVLLFSELYFHEGIMKLN